jgi:hypothetical protein
VNAQRVAVSSTDWLDGSRESIVRVVLLTLRAAQLRVQCADNETDESSSWTGDEDAEERALICLRGKHYRSHKTNGEADETEEDSASERVS